MLFKNVIVTAMAALFAGHAAAAAPDSRAALIATDASMTLANYVETQVFSY